MRLDSMRTQLDLFAERYWKRQVKWLLVDYPEGQKGIERIRAYDADKKLLATIDGDTGRFL